MSKITTLEELIKTLRPNITVFADDGEFTPEAADAYDDLVDIISFLVDQNVIQGRDPIGRLDDWSSDVLDNAY